MEWPKRTKSCRLTANTSNAHTAKKVVTHSKRSETTWNRRIPSPPFQRVAPRRGPCLRLPSGVLGAPSRARSATPPSPQRTSLKNTSCFMRQTHKWWVNLNFLWRTLRYMNVRTLEHHSLYYLTMNRRRQFYLFNEYKNWDTVASFCYIICFPHVVYLRFDEDDSRN